MSPLRIYEIAAHAQNITAIMLPHPILILTYAQYNTSGMNRLTKCASNTGDIRYISIQCLLSKSKSWLCANGSSHILNNMYIVCVNLL